MGYPAARVEDGRGARRDAVLHRTRTTTAGNVQPLLVVNISPGGLMARTDHPFAPGDRLAVTLPTLGNLDAEVRWALGGRIGCKFDAAIPAAAYQILLAKLGHD